MNTAIHTKIMQNAGKRNPFWTTDTRLMRQMVSEEWARWCQRAPGMIELTDKAEAYAAKEKRWVKGRVA